MNDLITHYTDSITHIYNPAKLLMGVVKRSLMSECVKDERGEQLSCNSPSLEAALLMRPPREQMEATYPQRP